MLNPHTLKIVLYAVAITCGVLFIMLTPVMAGSLLQHFREELEARKKDFHYIREESIAKKNVEVGRHRLELQSPAERAKQELREAKERQARKDSFFTDYWTFGDTRGLVVTNPLDDPRYNLATTGYIRLHLEMDEQNDSNIMQVANEGL